MVLLTRRGYLLAELLCAIALVGLLGVASLVVLVGARRSLTAAERRERAGRAEREAIAVLREAALAGDALVVRGDTALDLDLLLGLSAACAVEARRLRIPSVDDAARVSLVPQRPAADDIVALRFPGEDDTWWYSSVDSVRSAPAVAPCDASSGWATGSTDALELILRDSVPGVLQAGTPVRLARRSRFALYHAGGGDWMLGLRRCHPWLELCGVIQPITGPLRPPAAGGLRLAVESSPSRLRIGVRGADGGRGASAVVPW